VGAHLDRRRSLPTFPRSEWRSPELREMVAALRREASAPPTAPAARGAEERATRRVAIAIVEVWLLTV